MKYTKYIALFSVLFFAACTTELIEPSCNLNGSGVVQLASRVVPFSDRDVTTRANKNEAENKISSIDYLIFGAEDKCIFHQRVSSIDPLLVDKSDPIFKEVVLSNCYIVSIANGPVLNIDLGVTTWDIISSQSIDVSGVSINSGKLKENGLLMVGRYPETGTFNFGDTNQGSVLTIPMKSLFSKIVFNISVDADEIRPGENQPIPSFTLTNCTVHNVASEVDFIGGTESDDGSKNADKNIIIGTDDDIDVHSEVYSVGTSGTTTDGGTPLFFYFYLPERFLQAGTSPTEFQYPFGKGGAIREQDKDKRQQYKPLLAQGYKSYNINPDQNTDGQNQNIDKKATFVRLKGIYSDHQGHSFNVSYDLYVGNDNYGNFDIVRNTQYNNNVIIRGIKNSSNQSTDLSSVSIDHRVNVERGEPIIINLRRETLLDSHFEVRPLLIRKNGAYNGEIPSNSKVKVEVIYDETPEANWIGLERSFGNGILQTASNDTYLVGKDLPDGRKNAAGKRKYFTTNLTTETLNSGAVLDADGYSTSGGKTVVIPISNTDQRVWIYIDECTAVGDDVRSATIKVSWDLMDGNGYSSSVEYVINQRLLYPVTYSNHSYNIEYHEEYLYNYDSDDQYGQTNFEGMKWGLDGLMLSSEHRALYMDQAGISGFTSIVNNVIIPYYSPYYDYYLPDDLDHISNDILSQEKKEEIVHDRKGFDFCGEIISETNKTENSAEFGIGILDLGHDPKSAIEYCYNRNKRNSDGTITSITWYLPAIDEMEDIAMGGYNTFYEFQAQDYWSSQPAFLQNAAHYEIYIERGGSYMTDNVNYARATSVEYLGGGASNPDNYTKMESSMNNYYQVLHIFGLGQNGSSLNDIPNNGYNISYLWYHWSYPKFSTDPGYQPRTEENRIRCVYNGPTTES